MKYLFCVLYAMIFLCRVADANECHYSTYKWNTLERKALEFQNISKPYDQLRESEIDAGTGCSVCEEDQVEIQIQGIKRFKLCKYIANEIESVLLNAIAKGLKIEEVIGYRVGKTKGSIDFEGNRTKFSFHSFGVAMDINPQHNGLYDNCVVFGPSCRLIKGGEWLLSSEYALSSDSFLVIDMKNLGFKWGGEILGRQKDFMHFSISGY